ncbi:putative transcription factor MADS-type1 family [Helianthus anomalus]
MFMVDMFLQLIFMGRAKLKMELIAKEKTRNTTYHKRKQGIIKKANEFSILCDVDTSIIIFPPNSNEPEIWPENPDKIKKNIASHMLKKDETGKRTYDLQDFYEDRKKKIEDELVKARKKNMEAKYATWFDDLDRLNEMQLRQFAMQLEDKENVVRAYLELKKRNMNNIQLPLMFDPMVHYNQGLGSHLGLDHGHVMNHMSLDHGHVMNHDGGWFGDATFTQLKREQLGFGYYPVFDGGLVYDNPNLQWGLQQPVVHGTGVMQDNRNGVGEFMMDDQRTFYG